MTTDPPSPAPSHPLLKRAPAGLAIIAMLGPSLVWCAEYIGSGEVILATRTGAILGTSVLWAIVLGIFLKYWIGMSGARYTVCTGEGMIDMLDRMPGPSHWAVWIVLVVQFVSAALSIGSLATAAGAFLNNLIPDAWVPASLGRHMPMLCGWVVTFFAAGIVWSGLFNVLKMVMSLFVLVIVVGVLYVAVHVLPGWGDLARSLGFHLPSQVPDWALQYKGVDRNPWSEILPLIGWGAGGFASQVWYTYWVMGAGYGATAGRGYGRPADVKWLGSMSRSTAQTIKSWCRVLYADATFAMVLGIVITGAFYLAGAGILGPKQLAPEGPDVALTLSRIFSDRWGALGGFLFLVSGTAALVATQIGQLAGWPRLLADSTRLCFPGFNRKIPWKWQFRFFLLFFIATNMFIIFCFKEKPVFLVQTSAIMDGLLLTPLQALWVLVGLFVVLPKLLSKEAAPVLKPHGIFALGLLIAFLVFAYFCVIQIPATLSK
ncbi:MAG: Nramp family divalent metal transporter [Sedimentisphaerales bacterium]|nr:Nramp family divalent metal transporter [Sedimentisphaerales bacterium]